MTPVQKAYLQLHIAVVLFGFTAILGRLIELSEMSIVWWRLLLTCISLIFFAGFIKNIKAIPGKGLWQLAGIGWIVTLHWVFFYGSIKYSNVSVALVCLATTSFFTSVLEPLLLRKPFKWHETALGILVIPGMYLIVESIEAKMYTGVWMALVSAFLAAIFAIANKKMVDRYDPNSITFVELGSGWILLCLLFPFYQQFFPEATLLPTIMDFIYLIILALFCTTLAYVLSLKALKYISAFTANITINLEPIYGILLAIWIFAENKELNTTFYYGVLIILGAVFLHPVISKIMARK